MIDTTLFDLAAAPKAILVNMVQPAPVQRLYVSAAVKRWPGIQDLDQINQHLLSPPHERTLLRAPGNFVDSASIGDKLGEHLAQLRIWCCVRIDDTQVRQRKVPGSDELGDEGVHDSVLKHRCRDIVAEDPEPANDCPFHLFSGLTVAVLQLSCVKPTFENVEELISAGFLEH